MSGKFDQIIRERGREVLVRKVIAIPLLLFAVFFCTAVSQSAVGTGDLQITAQPGLRVYLDNEDNFVGKTNEEDDGLYLEELSAGLHTVIIKKTGFIEGRFTIEIKAGRAVEFIVDQLPPALDVPTKQREPDIPAKQREEGAPYGLKVEVGDTFGDVFDSYGRGGWEMKDNGSVEAGPYYPNLGLHFLGAPKATLWLWEDISKYVFRILVIPGCSEAIYGIKAGDPVERVLEVLPTAQYGSDSEACYYEYDRGKYIVFYELGDHTVKDNKITVRLSKSRSDAKEICRINIVLKREYRKYEGSLWDYVK